MASPMPLEAPVTMAARVAGMGRYPTSPGPPEARSAPAELRPTRLALRGRVADDGVDPLVEVGDDLVLLGTRQAPVLDGLVELLDRGGLDRGLQARDRLAAGRLRDVRQRLPGPKLLVELVLGQAEVLGGTLDGAEAMAESATTPRPARAARKPRPDPGPPPGPPGAPGPVPAEFPPAEGRHAVGQRLLGRGALLLGH